MKTKLTFILALCALNCNAQSPTETPEYVNLAADTISTPKGEQLDKWQTVANKLNALEDGKSTSNVEIMHIGDSHIQAEMGTSRLRKLLQDKYGNAGRGLITAFRMAGTNQPTDYVIKSENPTDSQARLLKRPWPIEPGFTGVASSSVGSNIITYQNLAEGHAFDHSTIYTSEGTRNNIWVTPKDSATFWAFPGERVYGVYTYNSSKPGVIYSSIGNNGACYSDYLLIPGFAQSVASFTPDIIILSMGTNEGFSKMTNEEIASTTRQLINELKAVNPNAAFLMWTPMECQKEEKVNTRVAEARDIELRIATELGIPVWDFYTVAGGEGASSKWLADGLMNKDRIHLYKRGYELQGDLAYKSIINLISKLTNH